MALTVLIVEDDAATAATLAAQMADFGHRTVLVENGHGALTAVRDDAFDIIVLDGIATLLHLRASGVNLPILMLAEPGAAAQVVHGLEAGADDYLVRPADPAECNARLNALVRARRWSRQQEDDTIRAGGIIVSPAKYRAWRDGRPLDLPRTELRLLTELVRHAGSVMTRPVLLQRVWNYDEEPTTNIVDTYIKRLRKKLTEQGGDDPISTLRGVGYMLRQ